MRLTKTQAELLTAVEEGRTLYWHQYGDSSHFTIHPKPEGKSLGNARKVFRNVFRPLLEARLLDDRLPGGTISDAGRKALDDHGKKKPGKT